MAGKAACCGGALDFLGRDGWAARGNVHIRRIRGVAFVYVVLALFHLFLVGITIFASRLVSRAMAQLPAESFEKMVVVFTPLFVTLVKKGFLALLTVPLLVLSVCSILAAVGLWRLRNWGRRLGVGFAILLLPTNIGRMWLMYSWPADALWLIFGGLAWTGVTAWVIWVLSQPDVKQVFHAS